MNISDKTIDGGKAFDWGRASADYAKYRDIYPSEFYDKIIRRKLCTDGQSVLDIGTGTGVLPRNMYQYGAKWTGIDISAEQIEHAKMLSKGMDIDYYTCPVEELNFQEHSFDVITACQCFGILIMRRLFQSFFICSNPTDAFLYCIWPGCLLRTRLPGQAKGLY